MWNFIIQQGERMKSFLAFENSSETSFYRDTNMFFDYVGETINSPSVDL